MANELETESIAIQIRAKLNRDKIKLWEVPFFDKIPLDHELKNLANNLSQCLKIPVDDCLKTIKDLQQNALEKLESRKEFQATGLATVKVKAPFQFGINRVFNLQIRLTDCGLDLIKLIGQKLEVANEKLKLVCSGRVICPEKTLNCQNVSNGSQFMVLLITQSEEKAIKEGQMYDKISKIKSDAEMLISANDRSDFMSLEDQEGNPIYLPKEEKKSLLMALTLYEKGKVALKRNDFNEALLLFLEADQQFRVCNSQLLDVVDNYALLNLDIVWCYLCLKSFNQLPDAEQRLKICEEKFRKSYGSNMGRVLALKGEKGNEKALLLRLHLLKAVLYFHQNKREDAVIMLELVENELGGLKIDDVCLSRLLEIGYNMKEARIALRACSNDMEASIELINNQRKKLEENERKTMKEKLLYKTIGHDADEGLRINMDYVERLVEMGFKRELAALALKKCQNDITLALNELQENGQSLKQELAKNFKPSTDLIDKLKSMGFDQRIINQALQSSMNNFDEALDFLVQLKNSGQYENLLQTVTDVLESVENQPGPSSPKKTKKKEEDEMMKILFKNFSRDMDKDADTYLDMPLNEEETILNEYKKLLAEK